MTDHNREELIERATWALIDYDTDVVDRGVRDEHYRERRADVERVWAAFEQAHAPTSDEREAEGWREAEAYADDHDPSKRAETADDFMAGWRTADRLRRTVQGEPSNATDPEKACIQWEQMSVSEPS